MKYFSEYQSVNIDNVNYKSGILEILKPEFIEGKKIIKGKVLNEYLITDYNLNRALDGSLVTIDITDNCNKIINIINNNVPQIIPGILYVHSKMLYGTNKKNMPIYLFKPDNWKLPDFYVASNIKNKRKNLYTNIYCTINYVRWDVDKKLPTGSINQIIGDVGIFEHENEYILHKHNLYFNNINKKKLSINEEIKLEKRLDLRDKFVLSIDPEGCKDIDDAIHINETISGYEVGIHIADVSHFIKENTELDEVLKNRLTSIYAPHKTINMLPDKLSNGLCSLLPNQDKYAFSTIFNFNKNFNIGSYIKIW